MKQKKPWYKNWIIWVAVIIVLGVIGMFMPKDDKEQTTSQETVVESVEPEETEEEVSEPEVETVDNSAKLQELIDKNLETYSPQHPDFLTLRFGDLEDATINEGENGNTLVIKAYFPDGGVNNEARKDQSFVNVEDLIRNQGAYVFDEIQYWAVEPLIDSETGETDEPVKVISFTIGKDAIDTIKAQTLLPEEFEETGILQDYWLHPAMR